MGFMENGNSSDIRYRGCSDVVDLATPIEELFNGLEYRSVRCGACRSAFQHHLDRMALIAPETPLSRVCDRRSAIGAGFVFLVKPEGHAAILERTCLP